MDKETYAKEKEAYIKQCKDNPNLMFIKALAKIAYSLISIVFSIILIATETIEGFAVFLFFAGCIAWIYFTLASIYSAYMLLEYKKQNKIWLWAYMLFGIFGAILLLMLGNKDEELPERESIRYTV